MNGVPVSTLRDPTPSPDDVAVTRAIVQAGKLLDVEVLDRAPWKGTVVVL